MVGTAFVEILIGSKVYSYLLFVMPGQTWVLRVNFLLNIDTKFCLKAPKMCLMPIDASYCQFSSASFLKSNFCLTVSLTQPIDSGCFIRYLRCLKDRFIAVISFNDPCYALLMESADFHIGLQKIHQIDLSCTRTDIVSRLILVLVNFVKWRVFFVQEVRTCSITRWLCV